MNEKILGYVGIFLIVAISMSAEFIDQVQNSISKPRRYGNDEPDRELPANICECRPTARAKDLGNGRMNCKGANALIIAETEGASEGLKALIESIPEFAQVYHMSDYSSAISLVNDRCPDLLLVNIELPADELESLLKYIKATCPRSRSVVLANEVNQQDLIRSAGADVVELIGIPAAKLAAIIQGQLVGEEGTSIA